MIRTLFWLYMLLFGMLCLASGTVGGFFISWPLLLFSLSYFFPDKKP
jgi:uncharacterized protein YneF (UPF0154 family)